MFAEGITSSTEKNLSAQRLNFSSSNRPSRHGIDGVFVAEGSSKKKRQKTRG
jgi:hypothetical protein